MLIWKKIMGCPAVSKSVLILVWMLLTWPKAHYACVYYYWSQFPGSATLWLLLVWRQAWAAFPSRASVICPWNVLQPSSHRFSPERRATGASIAHRAWFLPCRSFLNETPDESVLTNLAWVCGCHLPGEALSVSWECRQPKRDALHSVAASPTTEF